MLKAFYRSLENSLEDLKCSMMHQFWFIQPWEEKTPEFTLLVNKYTIIDNMFAVNCSVKLR